MTQNLVAKASTMVNAPRARVWKALVDPAAIKQYMFNTTVVSDFKQGSPITWSGEWEGKAYQDKGVILRAEPERVLSYSHFSPLMGKPDKPENYHNVTIELNDAGKQTRVALTQDNNSTEEARAQSEKNWQMMLEGLRKYVEK
jgi:uncharacterized protein YndB with AHSA1/START domain